MKTRFTFPAVNLGSPIEPQLANRAEWVGFQFTRVCVAGGPIRYSLKRGEKVFLFDTLCEVNLKLEHLLEALGDRIEQEEVNRIRAEQEARRQAQADIKFRMSLAS